MRSSSSAAEQRRRALAAQHGHRRVDPQLRNPTEPQAGSDLAAVAKAVPEGDEYRISGQKIFITYGEQDLTENIVHLVLARLPDALRA